MGKTMSGATPANRIELEPEAMRRLGYAVIDMLVEHASGLPDALVGRKGSRLALEERNPFTGSTPWTMPTTRSTPPVT